MTGRRRIAAAIGALVLLGGCTTARVAHPLTQTPLAASTPEAQSAYWYQLAKRPIASNDEAFHALLLYVDGTDANTTYAGRVNDLSTRHMLPGGFNGGADDAVDRGTLAVALDQMLHIKGGLTMQVFGPSPRYALRAAEDRGLFPPSSPNQGISGGEFVGVMQKAEEYEHGNPADNPVTQLPDQVHHVAMLDPTNADAIAATAAGDAAPVDSAFVPLLDTSPSPIYLDALAGPTTAPSAQTQHLRAIVTGVQGDLVEIRATPDAPWKPARPGMLILEGTEIRTGPKSAIRFLIPADEAFCLDSQGQLTLQQAVINLRKATTRFGLAHGRLREDLSHNAPVKIEEAGLAHDTVIQSPDSALALRGTKVSLFEQPAFDPVAVSLSGQAYFTNVAGLRVPFGGRRHTVIVGAQTSPAQQASIVQGEATANGNTGRLEFETRELSIVAQRGGFQSGDVIVGDQYISDFGYRPSVVIPGTGSTLPQTIHNLPGAIDFVLTWSGTAQVPLNALGLAVASPLNSTTSSDYVANLPYIAALSPSSPTTRQLEKTLYPQASRSGGHISLNSVGPQGLELAYFPRHYALGTYAVDVYDIIDRVPPPTNAVNPVTYTLNVYQDGFNVQTATGTIGDYQTKFTAFNIGTPPAPLTDLQHKAKKVKLVQATVRTPSRRSTS